MGYDRTLPRILTGSAITTRWMQPFSVSLHNPTIRICTQRQTLLILLILSGNATGRYRGFPPNFLKGWLNLAEVSILADGQEERSVAILVHYTGEWFTYSGLH